jgi:hypothetical protein
VAKHWNLTPGQWDEISNEDEKAEMIAHYNLENKIASYEALLREREFDRKSAKHK